MVDSERRDFAVSRVRNLAPSPTLAAAREARWLRAEGVDVVDFGPGEPDFVTPDHIREAAAASLAAGFTHYPPARGIPLLLRAIGAKLERENGLRYDPETEIVVTPGAKQALLEAVLTVVEPGDEVILFDPGWNSYDAIVRLAGGDPVHVQLSSDFSIDSEALQAAISPRTKALIIGSPGNPTGYVLTAQEWSLVVEVCQSHDLLLISDEIYERLRYRDVRSVSPGTLPGMRERTVTVNGFSKAYAMTGWRLGYAAAPAGILSQMLKVQEHTVTAATSFAQQGAVAALEGTQQPIVDMLTEFARRRELIVAGLNDLPGIRCLPPDGAFYVFPDVSATGLTGTQLTSRLLQVGVAVTPGCGFGDAWDTHVRLSFATSRERIETGLERMRHALEELPIIS